MSTKNKIIISIILVTLGAVMRVLPHAWNFAPIAGIALFAGAYLGQKYALILPALSLFLGDMFIGFYEWQLAAAVYGSFLLIGLASAYLRKQKSIFSVAGLSLGSSLLFFFLTNWAVWQFSSWYAPSLNGLLECYAMALPFFRNTLLGDLFYTGAFFMGYEAICILAKQNKTAISDIKIKA